MNTKNVLMLDAFINLFLGILLLLTIPFPETLPQLLGVPTVVNSFYSSVMGGVFIGIGIALWTELSRHKPGQLVGLGLGGAIAINVCGGITLFGWLISGKLDLPIRGKAFLWAIAILLFGVSSIELSLHLKNQDHHQ